MWKYLSPPFKIMLHWWLFPMFSYLPKQDITNIWCDLKVVVPPLVLNTCEALVSAEHHLNFNSSFWIIHKPEECSEGGAAKAEHMCKNSWHTKRSRPKTCKWKKKKKRICWGHSLFSPEAVIYLGQSPTLNHCVCFYGLSGFVCAPQPLKVVGWTADFSPNLGIVKPHHFLALEKCLASHFGCWGPVYISSDGACRWV